MSDRCERCGALIALVGRVHNCRGGEVWRVGATKKDVTPVTKIVRVTKNNSVTKKKRGRPKKAGAMTGAERVRKLRALRRALKGAGA